MTFDEIRSILKFKSVGIAGCGGLGSNCAVALARAGVGTLVIADFDVIVESNLNRQYFFHDQIGMLKVFALKKNLERINPYIKVHAFDLRLCPSDIVEIFSRCDVIVEAFDKAEMKQMIVDAVSNHLPEKYLVLGVGMGGWGDNNSIRTRSSGNLVICGDEMNEVSDQNPPIAPRVGVVASMQANAVLDILLGKNPEQEVRISS
jgi:sulfur carrier protein ThiS adenylyltransferase